MLVSVIIPSYKPQAYIWQCLESLLNQTLDRSSYEIIIVLNGCKEPYYSELDSFVEMHREYNLTLIQVDEGGVSNARNIGSEASRGEYIGFVDDDDYVSESYLEELLHASSIDTIGLCCPLAFRDGSESTVPYRLTNEFRVHSPEGRQRFYKPRRLFNGPCMKLIHRDIIQDVRFDTRFKNSEDSLFMFAVSSRIRWADFTSEKAVYYRRFREGSAVTKKRSFRNKFQNALGIIREESKLFFGNLFKYNLHFYLTRVCGAIRGIL